ncbi:MAG: ThuA domain-containing protein [Gemmataceae bacterium]|nr:ThuA domain-containing protein [Gemmataceae bacterium]
MRVVMFAGLLMLGAVVVAADPPARPRIDPGREALGQTGRVPVLVISGNDSFHRWKETTPLMRTHLEAAGRMETRIVEDFYILESPAALARYKAIVLSGQVATSTPAMRKNLEEYVRGGGGLVAIHWAIDSFGDWPEFVNLLGRRWKEGTSGEEHGMFSVTVRDRKHPITRTMEDFRTPEQEAIHFDLDGAAEIQVLATAHLPKVKKDVAVAYAYTPGKGRVVFTPLGHSLKSRDDPGFQKLISRAVEWAATGDVVEK